MKFVGGTTTVTLNEASDKVFNSYPVGNVTHHMAGTKQIAKKVIAIISPPASILDLGCGSGLTLAVLAQLGYKTTGVDDLGDPFFDAEAKKAIHQFQSKFNVESVYDTLYNFERENAFDVVLLIDVLEHLINPRDTLNVAISSLKAGGTLIIDLPSSVALLKRIKCLMGKTIYPPLSYIYYAVGPYRSHIREFTPSETLTLLEWSGLVNLKAEKRNTLTRLRLDISHDSNSVLKRLLYSAYYHVSNAYPNFRDSVLAWGQKPENWSPITDATIASAFRKYNPLREVRDR